MSSVERDLMSAFTSAFMPPFALRSTSESRDMVSPKPKMQFLRELCPTADEIVPGVYMGTGIETAFLVSYPKAKSQYPNSRLTIEVSRNHAVLLARPRVALATLGLPLNADAILVNGVLVYDPIGVALGRSPRETAVETVEEADFAEWWQTNLLLGWQHPSTDFIASVGACSSADMGRIERMHGEIERLRTLREEASDPVEQHVLLQGEIALRTAIESVFGSAGRRARDRDDERE